VCGIDNGAAADAHLRKSGAYSRDPCVADDMSKERCLAGLPGAIFAGGSVASDELERDR
jgi:hypothetical protein